MTKLFYTLRLMGHPMRTPLSLVRYATSPHDAENRPVSRPRAGPPEPQRFAKLINVNTHRAYRQDIHDSVAFAVLRRGDKPATSPTPAWSPVYRCISRRAAFFAYIDAAGHHVRPRPRAFRDGLT
jgi:hypothetical protein